MNSKVKQYYKGKKVLVTGASSGIGISFTRLLASFGAELILTARRQERLKSIAEELSTDDKVRVHVIVCDLSDPEGPKELVRELAERELSVDILINNAGFGYNGRFEDGKLEQYEDMMQVNMQSLVILTRLLIPDMLAKGSGGVLNIASMAGFLPIPYFSVYSATKQFVINVSLSLRKEVKKNNVHVSVLCPGPVDTEFLRVAGISKKKAAFRGLQSPQSVALKGLKALAGNKKMAVSRAFLWGAYLFSKWLPLSISMFVGGIAMKKK
ncbi:SDR family oxidoreductase [Balneolaceae bacterium ANBcel3]|nr:SDR family oxidoreductase [Balneolaceae bacterium ANBcel3]